MTGYGLLTVFLAIGGLGFLFLVASLIIGDLFDALGFDFNTSLDSGHDFGVFDSRVIAIFLTAFGGFGAIGATLGFSAVPSSAAGIAGGLIFGALVFYFGKFLYQQQASSSVTEADLIGRTAQVTVGIQPNQIGQITCLVGEERVEKIARALGGAEIKAGSVVRIESITGDAVIVSVDEGDGKSLFPVNE